jgi:hypothetical protein
LYFFQELTITPPMRFGHIMGTGLLYWVVNMLKKSFLKYTCYFSESQTVVNTVNLEQYHLYHRRRSQSLQKWSDFIFLQRPVGTVQSVWTFLSFYHRYVKHFCKFYPSLCCDTLLVKNCLWIYDKPMVKSPIYNGVS